LSRNRGRVGTTNKKPDNTEAPVQDLANQAPAAEAAFSFVVPTEFVELPSGGTLYPEGHPLHGESTIEIKQMTAKEEDMLTSRALLKKGIALERVLQSLVCNKAIDPQTLLLGDKNALVIATRVSAYGNIYTTEVTCPACDATQQHSFDLLELEARNSNGWEDFDVVENEDCTFTTVLPRSKVEVTFKLLTGYDEERISSLNESDRKRRQERSVTRQLEGIIVAVNGIEDAKMIRHLVENIPSVDSRHLRSVYRMAMPNIDMSQDFECEECSHEQEMEVPLTADFFWPQ